MTTIMPQKSSPKWRQLHDTLRSGILSGRYERGATLPSHDRLAQQYGVSVPTVREAITALVRDQFLVCQHGKGTYVAEQITPPKARVEVIKPNRAERDMQETLIDTLNGISQGAREYNLQTDIYSVMVGNAASGNSAYRTIIDQADGAIALPDTPDQVIRYCLAGNTPVVLADASFRRTDVPRVMLDRRTGAKRVLEHLYRLGHRRLAYVGRTIPPYGGVETEQARLLGFLDAISLAGVGIGPGHFIQCQKHYHSLREGSRRILANPPQPTAIVCSTALAASAVMGVLMEEGISVPEEVSLASLFDVEGWDYPDVELTGLETPFEDAGKHAARLIRAIIDRKDIQNSDVVLQCPLIEGTSTGPPPRSI